MSAVIPIKVPKRIKKDTKMPDHIGAVVNPMQSIVSLNRLPPPMKDCNWQKKERLVKI